jgi:hypothetical protein
MSEREEVRELRSRIATEGLRAVVTPSKKTRAGDGNDTMTRQDGPLVLDQLRHLIAHARDQHMEER